jgi:hypothetical protein
MRSMPAAVIPFALVSSSSAIELRCDSDPTTTAGVDVRPDGTTVWFEMALNGNGHLDG